jgi:hypothetical protein
MYKGTTPTFIFTFSDFDPTTAEQIIVTFSNGLEIMSGNENMEVTTNRISLWLDQSQTLAMPNGNVNVQINFLLADGNRVATNVQTLVWSKNLHNEVMQT